MIILYINSTQIIGMPSPIKRFHHLFLCRGPAASGTCMAVSKEVKKGLEVYIKGHCWECHMAKNYNLTGPSYCMQLLNSQVIHLHFLGADTQ